MKSVADRLTNNRAAGLMNHHALAGRDPQSADPVFVTEAFDLLFGIEPDRQRFDIAIALEANDGRLTRPKPYKIGDLFELAYGLAIDCNDPVARDHARSFGGRIRHHLQYHWRGLRQARKHTRLNSSH